ncbi:hypothetical protein GGS23DRAFT_462120 [Durotheca rogersii]|uniref:uncharacterized protein n=1 Tax=Durotheca rogersii TaxID=419775 RepID=UPI00221F2149|nr:uncharacterized protein GGS23DRAFT_462120 [Durotheca rogersii]KAI5864757.1 hypothetical protein GGS23DRAFT_462120 [Durotheca rogersii]
MSAPYWGQLPPSKARRMSGDYDQTDRRQSLDQTASQSQSRSNRLSLQTESTPSPLISPVTSSFPATSLAPRPPSLPYGQNRYRSELQERRQRRTSRAQDDDDDDDDNLYGAATSPPPAAPEVPRAPPVSYKDPYRIGSPTYTYSADGRPGPPISAYGHGSPHARILGMESESFYKDATPPAEKQARAPVLDRSRQAFDEDKGSSTQWDNDPERITFTRLPANTDPIDTPPADSSLPKRRATLSAQPQHPTWADDRSPLQRLELTLDSITKEEKRARVEAAERRAIERTTRKDSVSNRDGLLQPAPERSIPQQAQYKDKRPARDREGGQRAGVADPIQAQPSAVDAIDESWSQKPRKETRQYSPPDPSPESQIPAAKGRQVISVEKFDLPQRNLSFRERAARNDANLPRDAGGSSPTSPNTALGGGFSLTRSGSNKLKKNPPADPRYGARRDSEEKSAAYGRRGPQAGGENGQISHANTAAAVTAATADSRVETARGMTSALQYGDRPPAKGKQVAQGGSFEDPFLQRKGYVAATAPSHADSSSNGQPSPPSQHAYQSSLRNTEVPKAAAGNPVKSVKFPDRKYEARAFSDEGHESDTSGHSHGFYRYLHRGKLRPGRGMYQPPKYLDEWKQATVGKLSGALLDLSDEPAESADKGTAWWEGQRRGTVTARPQEPETSNGIYDDTQGPTRFKPPLYLKCGPLLRYCGIRHEKPAAQANHANATTTDRHMWRGSIMIVTRDSESSYDVPPILRLFVQPIELLPPPPAELRSEQALLPEYVDPILGIPKLGRRGETLFVRPVEHLEEGKDVSMLEPDDGLFEITRSTPDFDGAPDPPGSFANRKRRTLVDGEKLGRYKDVRGFRLHAERGHTFWRFNIEIELRDEQQRIAYRINHGPATGFWVPARNQSMNIMSYSCNGFSLSVNPDDLSGPDPMWRDVLNNHQTRPFHVMIGGGDQIYNDAVMQETKHFRSWLQIKNPLHKNNAPFTAAMQDEMENFYLNRYMMWFSQGLFSLANCQIPMVNMYDDHDIIDGFGSYPDHFMKSPVFSGLGNVAFKYYMLFQHQSLPGETEKTEPSWALGLKPGPYIRELSHSLFMSLGGNTALLAVDCRTERTRDEVVREDTWKRLMDRCYDEIVKGETQHLLVLLGVPIAYPRLVWLETILTSRLMDPIKALGKTGMLGNFLNHFDGGVEVLDDLDDHWTAKNHKDERRFVIEDLQDLAADKSVRVTILSGDVHLAAIGQFYSNPKQKLAKHKDFRYMPNIISSAIANTPPPDLMADILNKRNKVHHFDKETDEDMIPIFTHDVDGKPRNNKHLLPHRNWCSIRPYQPGQTPPSTPPPEAFEPASGITPPESRGGLFRRFSLSGSRRGRGPPRPEMTDRSRPPVSGSGGGFLRSLSRRRASASDDGHSRPGKILRTLSLGRVDSTARPRTTAVAAFGGGSGRMSMDQPDDGGVNGTWGGYSDEDIYDAPVYPPVSAPAPIVGLAGNHHSSGGHATAAMGLRGGGGAGAHRNDEYEAGDDAFFTARAPQRALTQPAAVSLSGQRTNSHTNHKNNGYDNYDDLDDDGDERYYDYHYYQHATRTGSEPYVPRRAATVSAAMAEPAPKPFHRTPTGLSARKLRKDGPARYEVDLTGGLDVCLNVEVNARDPAGITVPYRLLVPRLWYEYQGEDGAGTPEEQEPEPEEEEEPASGAGRQAMPPGPRGAATPPPAPHYGGNVGPGGMHDDYDGGEEGEERGPYDDDGEGKGAEGGGGNRVGRGLKRLFSGSGGGSHYRARRQSP